MVQYSNRAKTCHQSEKDFTILKQSENLSPVRKRWYKTETLPKPVNRQKKDGLILKRSNLSPVRKRWYNTETVQKPVTSQKKMVQYSNRAKTCQQSEKDGTILKQGQNLSRVKKGSCNTQIELKLVTSQKKK